MVLGGQRKLIRELDKLFSQWRAMLRAYRERKA